ncbi:uncharacterized protein LOC127260487 [Andrographis paniculata]|uniref:uncharacterized protein LOC127260487 n=1 Tax=Andrographis paniculata TaxID=175694 RepID=UPI0021E96873|nr:uncharacterized protein LOC127260487 [Andrographis paniculata]
MEFFSKTKAVRLKSHMNKYLIADDDQISIRQSRSGVTTNAWWSVEVVDSNPHAIRLKGCHNCHLTASSVPFLLGMTGLKIFQTLPESYSKDPATEWRPIRDGFQVKLKAHQGTYLRANGGTPPWRNSVTHDCPIVGATHNYCIVWEVETVELLENEAVTDFTSTASSFSPFPCEMSSLEFDCFGSPVSFRSWFAISVSASSRWLSTEKVRTLRDSISRYHKA